MTSSDDDLRYE
jgi:hypothetical protein